MQKLVTSDEKLIYYENPERRKHWVDPGQPITSAQKRNVFGKKILIHIWWDEWDPLYYELLKPRKNPRKKTLYGTWASTSDITAQQC